MGHQEDFVEGHDGLRLYWQCWLPSGEPGAAVIVLHGFTEHGGRYASLAAELAREGYAVYALDVRGHGRSEGERVYVDSFDEYLADLEVLFRLVSERQPGRPVFLFGHSMGGAIVIRFVLSRRPEVKGIALSAPAARIGRSVFPLLRRMAWVGSRLWPRLKVVRMGAKWVSRDPQTVAEFRSDPLVFHRRFPVRMGAEILRAAAQIRAQAAEIRVPLLILQGTADRAVDPAGSRQLYACAASEDKTLRLYEGLYHDLLHEPERQQVTADLIEWLNRRR